MMCFICNNKKYFKSLKPDLCKTNNFICEKCGLVFIDRGKKSMQEYYKDDGYFKKSPNVALQKQFISKSLLIQGAKERVALMLKVTNIKFEKKRVLDIGCAYGEILYYLKKKYHCQVLGLEPSRETADIGEKMFDVPIKPILLEEFKDVKKFDIILCNHTVEHVDDPIGFVKEMKNHLKDDGILYIEVPNVLKPTGGFNLDLFFYNEHLQNFSRDTLNKLLNGINLYTYAYSDENFLRFICGKNKKKSIQIPPVTADEIMNFLTDYKKNYSFTNVTYVYMHKFSYLLKLIFFKGLDYIRNS